MPQPAKDRLQAGRCLDSASATGAGRWIRLVVMAVVLRVAVSPMPALAARITKSRRSHIDRSRNATTETARGSTLNTALAATSRSGIGRRMHTLAR